MTAVIRKFLTDLYVEHLEDAGFLYQERKEAQMDSGRSWLDLEESEERFEARIDALIVGDRLAVEVCQEQMDEGDPGELHAVMVVFCRRGEADLFFPSLEKVDWSDADRVRAVIDALREEMPETWHSRLVDRWTTGSAPELAALAEILGYQRSALINRLIDVLPRAEDAALRSVLWALGRARGTNTREPMRGHLKHPDPLVRATAALSLLRQGEHWVISHCQQDPESLRWAALPLGLAGTPSSASGLRESIASRRASPECLIGLALLGEPASVESLLAGLDDPVLAEASSFGLQILTGAGLREEVEIPEEIDEDELFDEERERPGDAESPLRTGSPAPAARGLRISRSKDAWSRWLSENRARLAGASRLRNGTRYTVQALVETMCGPATPHRQRQLTYEELVVRYGLDIAFEADYTVRRQRRALAEIERWELRNRTGFSRGSWFFSGRVIA